MDNNTHSVTLDKEKCKGCINCIKKCPTEAIRVRNGKAIIISDRCIDCGECIRICPNHAKKAVSDPLSILGDYKFNIVLPAPTLYSQFKKVTDVNIILTALLEIGFDDLYEVSLAAQSISNYTHGAMSGAWERLHGPIISSACPAVVKLISIRFPGLVDSVMNVIAPVELAAIAARKNIMEKTGLAEHEIGVFFVSPCPAKITAAKNPIGLDAPVIDGSFSMAEVYRAILPKFDKISKPKKLLSSGWRGVGWASSGGEAVSAGDDMVIAADGIENVIKVLDEMENEKLQSIRFVELNACPGGCVGGCLTVENTFVARSRLKRMCRLMEAESEGSVEKNVEERYMNPDTLHWKRKLKYEPILRIDADRAAAIRKMSDIERIFSELPDIDCGSCGAPSCRALAEDIVMGTAQEGDCVFKLREKMHTLFREMAELQEYMPPPFREAVNEESDRSEK